VAHYVDKHGRLGNVQVFFFYSIYLFCSFAEELLIDFRELIGEHSGENMAEVVWETLKRYGLEKRVR
jgi:hypothetical protein